MWRKHAASWAALVVAAVVIASCVAWGLLAQVLVTPASG